MNLSVCIPVYNENSIISDTLSELYAYLADLADKTGAEIELIFADDGSTDGSGDTIRRDVTAKSMDKISVKVAGYAQNMGKGYAVRHGVLASTGDIVMFTDCDIAYGTDVIGRAYEVLSENGKSDYKKIDALIGSRNTSADDGYYAYSKLRKILSKVYIKVLNIAAGFSLTDSQCGFKSFNGDSARRVFSLCETNGFAFDIEVIMIAQKLGYTISEMPVRVIKHGESKVRIVRDSVKMLSDIRKIKKHVRTLDKNNGGRK